jgi:UDP:flavonoid glycosyltransferase YjiC (YdhE family)
MTIVVLTGGSRGDTQPYAALALGFARAGHRVRFATIAEFAPMVAGSDVEVIINEIDVKGMLGSGQGTAMIGAGRNQLRFLLNFSKMVRPLLERGLDRLVEVCRDCDGLMLSSTQILMGTAGNERLGVPFLAAYPMPGTATRQVPSILAPELPDWWPGRGAYNRFTHWFFDRLRDQLLGNLHAQVFAELPDPVWMQSAPMPILYGYSPEVVPRPDDWPEHVQVTGYWFLDTPGYQPPPELEQFLADGPAPVFVGFGSMNDPDPEGATRLVCRALEMADCRGVLVTAWGGLHAGNLPAHVRVVETVPYDWLFPRMCAVVHHCGAGTTGIGLRAGKPTVGIPHFGDQYFWARRVWKLGAGPAPIPRRRLTAERLARAIRTAVESPAIRERAAMLGERIRKEDGVGQAVELAVRHFQAGASRRHTSRPVAHA